MTYRPSNYLFGQTFCNKLCRLCKVLKLYIKNLNMKFLFTGVVSFLLFVTLNTTIAQSVKGILTDETDKSPIVGATVKLLNRPDSSNNQDSSTAYTTVSDKDGAFIF